MEKIAEKESKAIWFHELIRPYNEPLIFNEAEYVCILFNNDPSISKHDQKKISDQIIKTGCKYVVCAGFNCSSWDTSIDLAYLETDKNYNPSDETMVMTSWHEDESIEDILFFGLNNTNFDYHDFNRYLILFIDKKEGLKQEIKSKIKSLWI